MGSRSSALEATAHHEAGHAVVAFYQGVGIRRISIQPGKGYDGIVQHDSVMGRYNPERDSSPQVRIRGERLIRICLAGPIAQRKYRPRSWRREHGATDFHNATDMILRLADPGKHADTYMQLLYIEAENKVERHWELIQALAAELLQRRKMTGMETKAFIQQWHEAQFKAAYPDGVPVLFKPMPNSSGGEE